MFPLPNSTYVDTQVVAKAMVVGILPLGKENRSFKTLFPSANLTSKAR